MYPKRHYNKWTVNELLTLQREYELLEWNIQQIAEKHERTVDSILYRLEYEGLIDSRITARVGEHNLNVSPSTSAEDLNQRMWNLESCVSEMKTMVKQMVNNFMEDKRQKKSIKPLRNVAVYSSY